MSISEELFEHSILEEQSDFRIHVGFQCGLYIVFETERAKQEIRKNDLRFTAAVEPGADFTTAEGWLCPIRRLGAKLIEFKPEKDVFRMTLAERGDYAERLVLRDFKGAVVVKDRVNQLKGRDIRIGDHAVQVKCDLRAGPREDGGTGNVFLEHRSMNFPKRMAKANQRTEALPEDEVNFLFSMGVTNGVERAEQRQPEA